MDNNNLLEEFEKLITDFFELPDDQLEAAKNEFLQAVVAAYTGPQALDTIDGLILSNDRRGGNTSALIRDINSSKEIMYNFFADYKEHYQDSSIRMEILDNMASIIENFLNMVIMRVSSRNTTNIFLEKIHPNAQIPTYAHDGDQGADIYAVEDATIAPHTYGNMVSTGLKMIIPDGWAVAIRPRSGLSKKTALRISNAPATIDAQYRGEVKILFDNVGDDPVIIKAGDRIAQFILEKNYHVNFNEIDEVPEDTERGAGGFGSSDK